MKSDTIFMKYLSDSFFSPHAEVAENISDYLFGSFSAFSANSAVNDKVSFFDQTGRSSAGHWSDT
jgi:hypothetical protein